MSDFLICLSLLLFQRISLHQKTVRHMPPNDSTIDAKWGGDVLELMNAPPEIFLPQSVPRTDSEGDPWTVDVKNLGPSQVMISGKAEFHVQVVVGQTIHIASDGMRYILKH